MVGWKRLKRHVGRAKDYRQQIVEIVRDTSRKLADRLQTLGLFALPLNLLASGDIDDRAGYQDLVICDERFETDFHRELTPVLPARNQFHSQSKVTRMRLARTGRPVFFMRMPKVFRKQCFDGSAD